MNVTTIGLDLAKNLFQLHGVDRNGKVVFKKQLRRSQLIEFIANLPKCLIGMEACSSSHFWARKFESLGHTVKLMAPQFVVYFTPSRYLISRHVGRLISRHAGTLISRQGGTF